MNFGFSFILWTPRSMHSRDCYQVIRGAKSKADAYAQMLAQHGDDIDIINVEQIGV